MIIDLICYVSKVENGEWCVSGFGNSDVKYIAIYYIILVITKQLSIFI